MSEESNSDLLNTLVEILPEGILLMDLWQYKYIKTFKVITEANINIDVYELTWNNDLNIIRCTKNIMQEKFDILNLHKKILSKPYRNISEEEKIYLVKYYRILEKVNV